MARKEVGITLYAYNEEMMKRIGCLMENIRISSNFICNKTADLPVLKRKSRLVQFKHNKDGGCLCGANAYTYMYIIKHETCKTQQDLGHLFPSLRNFMG